MENFKIIEAERFMLPDTANESSKLNLSRSNVTICPLNELSPAPKIVLARFAFELAAGVTDKFLTMQF